MKRLITFDSAGARASGCVENVLVLMLWFLLGAIALGPRAAYAADIEGWIGGVMTILQDAVIPLIIALAFLVFIFKITQYFIFNVTNAGNKEKGTASGREKAKQVLLWGVIGLLLLFIGIGIVRIVLDASGLSRTQPVYPDYRSAVPDIRDPSDPSIQF